MMRWDELVDMLLPLILQVLALFIAWVIKGHVIPYLRVKLGVERLEAIARIAREAYAFVEVQAPELHLQGKQKLEMAIAYVNARLAELHLSVTVEQIRAAIEDVWLEYNPPLMHEEEIDEDAGEN